MRIIKFKPADSFEFINYIDIGSSERDYYYINLYLPSEQENRSGKRNFDNYNSWFDNFKNESIGSKMIIIHYYISEYMGWSKCNNTPQLDYFVELYGEKTTNVISSNLDFFLNFINQWFDNEFTLFNGLDLDWDDINERIVSTKENENGNIIEIKFNDNSTILFVDEDDTIRSFYVAQVDFPDLKNDIDRIVNMFQP